MVCEGFSKRCGRLPVPIEPCPECEARGIHCKIEQTRSWTWLNARKFMALKDCRDNPVCETVVRDGGFVEYDIQCDCPMATPPERAGLLWIGEAHYKTPADFLLETDLPHPDGRRMGVSRRIAAVPKGFKLGETWVFVAHPKAISKTCPACLGHLTIQDEDGTTRVVNCETCKGEGVIYKPAIFHAFQPTALEYVVTGEETDEELEALEARGFTLVQVETEEQYYERGFPELEQDPNEKGLPDVEK